MADKPVTRRDSLDFRDHIYQPSLQALPSRLLPKRSWMVVRDQGREGSCTGFGLAAAIDYMYRGQGFKSKVSARMLYEMAKRHDHWPGDAYEGSSTRGAMKGWHKNGVCAETVWPCDSKDNALNPQRQQAALAHPLGAYYRVLPRRADLHCALNETGVIYASAQTHAGWELSKRDKGVIKYKPGIAAAGGHAFAIIGYTEQGFILQNSWGRRWGGLKIGRTLYAGCALWTYEDSDEHLWDAWVARPALPVKDVRALDRGGFVNVGGQSKKRIQAPPLHEISDHYIHIDDGQFEPFGDYPSPFGTQPYKESTEPRLRGLRGLLRRAIGADKSADGNPAPKHLLFYAHGGLNDVKSCAARVGAWRPVFAANQIREIHFIWETGFKDELRDVLLGKQDFAKERAGGAGDWWDKAVERASHTLGYALWKEMRADAERAFEADAAGTYTLAVLIEELAKLPASKRPRLHLVGHSAGSILFAHLLARWSALQGPAFENLILFAPACTCALYESHIYPALKAKTLAHLHHFHLDEKRELADNVAQIYRKSLLYLVSRSFQEHNAVVPIMGMESAARMLKTTGVSQRLLQYNTRDHTHLTNAMSHGGFDNDKLTMNTTLQLVLGHAPRQLFADEHMKGY